MKIKLPYKLRSLLQRLPYLKPVRLIRRRLVSGVEVIEADIGDMKNILDDLTAHTPGAYFDDRPFATNFIAVRKRRILGVVQLVRYPIGEGPFAGHWLMGLYVWPRYRGLGVGALLTRRVIQQSHYEAASELSLLVWEENLPAVALYRGLHFRRTEIPSLEEELLEEKKLLGRRRIVLTLELQS